MQPHPSLHSVIQASSKPRGIVPERLSVAGIEMEDLESLVVKLRKRLEEASQETLQEDKVWKILTKLAQLPMSLELLQVTHIGKQVNSFKKHNGRIGQKAKELVTKWKELVPDEAPQEKRAPAQTGTTTPQGPTHTNRHRRETHSTPAQSTSSQAHAPNRGHAPIDLAVAVSAVGSSRKDKATPKATPIHTSGSWSTKDTTPIYSESESREDGYGPTNSSSSSAAKKRKVAGTWLELLAVQMASSYTGTIHMEWGMRSCGERWNLPVAPCEIHGCDELWSPKLVQRIVDPGHRICVRL
ncbi:hypothetical protein EMCRGX_G015312 [Ephydatia muelleri]